jgi:NAD(P)H-dependent flavin oxidoreductase YrpB (nitropropane dioxygenase family)
VAAGGIYDGRGIAASLMLGASAVWVGTRFVTARESGAPEVAKRAIISADFDSTIKSTLWTGRPLRALATPYVRNWEANRAEEMKALQAKGVIALHYDMDRLEKSGGITEEIEDQSTLRPMGQVSGLVNTPGQSAKEIVDEMMEGAVRVLGSAKGLLREGAKL